MDKSINQRVTYYRKRQRLTQTQVAQMMGIKMSTYSQCERRGHISGERLIKLAEILEVSCDTLLYGEEPQTPTIPQPQTFETEFFTNKEKSLIKVLRTLTDKKRQAIFKITELTYKRKLDPTAIFDKNFNFKENK